MERFEGFVKEKHSEKILAIAPADALQAAWFLSLILAIGGPQHLIGSLLMKFLEKIENFLLVNLTVKLQFLSKFLRYNLEP